MPRESLPTAKFATTPSVVTSMSVTSPDRSLLTNTKELGDSARITIVPPRRTQRINRPVTRDAYISMLSPKKLQQTYFSLPTNFSYACVASTHENDHGVAKHDGYRCRRVLRRSAAVLRFH